MKQMLSNAFKYLLISENVIFVRAEREESRIAFERNAKLNLGL